MTILRRGGAAAADRRPRGQRQRVARAVRCGAVLALCAAGMPGLAAAQALVSDRPDFVESSDVVGRRRLQVEAGATFERAQGRRTRGTPLLLRLGVTDALELRLETDGALRASGGGAAGERGWSDAALGVKWHARDGEEAAGTPGLALLAHVDVDSGSPAFRGNGLRPSLRGVAEWALPGDFSLGLMPGVAWDRAADGGRFAFAILAMTLGTELAPGWRGFVEIAGQQLAGRRHGGKVVTFDTGVTWLLSNDVQLDLSAARGLTDAAPRLQWGLGVALRF